MGKLKPLNDRIKIAIPLLIILIGCFKNKNFYLFIAGLVSLVIIYEYINNLNLYFKKSKDYFKSTLLLIIGIFWLAPFLLSSFKISNKDIMLIIIVNSISDTFQYLAGSNLKQFFNHKPFKNISPNKSTIGYIVGLTSSYLILSKFMPYSSKTLGYILFLGVVGDLFASKIKRIMEIKDYSNILGSHGGILDRLDSIIFTMSIFNLIKTD